MYVNTGNAKSRNRGLGWIALATALVCLPLGLVSADEGDETPAKAQQVPQQVHQQIHVTVVNPTASDETATTEKQPQQVEVTLDLNEVQPGKYWIGVVCSPLDNDLLKTHLDVEHGMVVLQVVKDSPAEKAGLQIDDILIQVGGQPLSDLNVLVTSTEQAEGTPLTLTLVRKGQRQEVSVTPVERPAEYSVHQRPDKEAVAEWKMLQEALRKQGATAKQGDEDAPDANHTNLMVVMPAFVLPDKANGLPKNLEVTITQKGQEDAEITVKQDDQQWKVDAKSLDKLPDNIRPHIEKMLGRGREMSIRVESKGIDLLKTLPHDLFAPQIIRKSLQIVPDKVYELHQFAPELNIELREKVQQQLLEAQRTLQEAESKIPADSLEKIEHELKLLREQLEQLRDKKTVRSGEDGKE